MKDRDYREIFESTRRLLKELGLANIDERIMSDLKGSDGAYWDLIFYLKHLTEEVALGSDIQLGNILHRVNDYVQTESGKTIEGVRVIVSEDDRERYKNEHIDLLPNPKLRHIVQELRTVIEELKKDYQKSMSHKEDINE